jgi:four helix bundle protein
MTDKALPTIEEWEKRLDESRVGDPLWSVQAYRISIYAIESHTFDRQTGAALRGAPALDQLTRALGSIAANIAEGYSRGTLPDRCRFYSYALGSTREAIAWYDTLRLELGEVAYDRQSKLIQIRRLLLTTLRRIRPEGPSLSMRDLPPEGPSDPT